MKLTETANLVLTLTVICVVSAGALALVYNLTYPIIEENRIGEMRHTLKESLPSAVSFDEPEIPKEILEQKEGVKQVFVGLDENREPIGIAAVVEGAGYQDFIKLLVAVDSKLTEIKSVVILSQQETPGLGSRIEEDDFIGQFEGEVKEDYDAITGATVSSTTVISLVKKALDDLKAMDGEELADIETDLELNETEADSETEASPEWNESWEENGTDEQGSTV